ncbi:hypothetical protein [Hominenteromicrobium sp.]|uniref:hypothetical protein n=1 Tax=Hominenteromicrobium sp. TaxID=3073581 RepID=UPI003AB74DD9
MKAKRILAMLMAGALLLGTAAGCGSSGTTSSTSGGTDSTTTGGTTDNTDNGGKSDAKLTIWVYGWEKASADKIQEDTAAYKEATGVEVRSCRSRATLTARKFRRHWQAATTLTLLL